MEVNTDWLSNGKALNNFKESRQVRERERVGLAPWSSIDFFGRHSTREQIYPKGKTQSD